MIAAGRQHHHRVAANLDRLVERLALAANEEFARGILLNQLRNVVRAVLQISVSARSDQVFARHEARDVRHSLSAWQADITDEHPQADGLPSHKLLVVAFLLVQEVNNRVHDCLAIGDVLLVIPAAHFYNRRKLYALELRPHLAIHKELEHLSKVSQVSLPFANALLVNCYQL